MAEDETVAHLLQGQEAHPSATLKPEPAPLERFAGLVTSLRDGVGPVQLGRTLGEGGLGVVRVAQQASLGREVAAKQLKTDTPSPALEHHLLQEAWTVGQLEHPNVVPIHDVTLDEHGRLTLLLKKVDGDNWGRWIADPDGLSATFGTDDVLGWHLNVLITVCHAVAFAHDRGVLHRDLKPENVMVGAFGEVVVVDWGIAAGMRAGAVVPPASARLVVGTPLYMAPEMWLAPGSVDARTDVYLLGAILHEVLTGRAPHRGQNFDDPSTIAWTPALPEDVPAGLADIVRTAMAAEPDRRFDSAETFRRAVDSYLAHRGSLALTDEADDLSSDLAGASPDEQERLFDAARFAYSAALRQWADNQRALEGLQRLLECMARHRIDAGDIHGADRLLGELHEGRAPELREQVRALTAEEERMAAIARRADPRVGASNRAGAIIGLAVLWVSLPFTGHLLDSGEPPTHGFIYGSALALFVLTASAITALRRSIWESDLTRQLVGWLLLTPVLQGIQAGGLHVLGLEPLQIMASQFFLWGTTCTLSALVIDRRIAIAGVAYFAAYFLAVQYLDHRYLIMAGPNTVLALVVLWIYLGAHRIQGT